MVSGPLGSPLVFAVVASHGLAATLTVGLTVYVARNYWDKTIGKTYTLLVASTSVGILGSLARTFVTDLDAFVALSAVKYVGIATAPVFLLGFALLYDGRNHLVSWRRVVVLLIFPFLTVGGVATTRVHGLVYQGYGTTSLGSIDVVSITDVGPWYWLFACYSWGILVVGTGVILYAGVTRSRFYRRQTAVVLPAVVVSWGANLAYAIFGWPHLAVDPTPIAFAVANALFSVGIFSTRLIDVTPADRSALLNVIEEAVVVLDEDDRIVDHNDPIRPLLSEPRPTGEPADRALPEEVVETTADDPTTIELTVDSRRRFYRRRRLSFGPEGTYGSAIVLTEVTDEKESQKEFERAHQRLRQVLDLVPDPVFAKNLDDEVLLSNEANADLHGMTTDEIEGKRERAIEPEVENIEDFDTYRQREVKVVETGEQMTFEEELTGPNGDTYVFKTTRIPFETAGSDEDAVLGYARDVTDLKEYERELKETKERLERTNEELELLNRILRHDVQNDVRVALRFGEELENHVDGEAAELLDSIERRNEHAVDLTRTLRDLMEVRLGDERERNPVRIDEVLESEVAQIAEAYPGASVSIDGTTPETTVLADRMLPTVFRNLLENAVEHNDDDPTVSVEFEEGDEGVVVRVADDGPGIPESHRDAIFGKGENGLQSKGTGVGLYLVAVLVEEYGGEVWIEENRPEGSVFVVELPKA
jgi:PAS domain S-box-containing protein